MAEAFLEEIYKEAELAYRLKLAVEYARIHDELHMGEICNEIFQPLCGVCKEYLQQDREKGLALWNAIQTFTGIDNDLVMRGDVIEKQILPLLGEKIRLCGGDICVENEEGDFLFESSVSGFLTLKDLKHNKYIHSASDPMWEARKLAEYIFTPEKKEYSIRGLGLGYLIYQLYVISAGTVRIHVFEKDARMVEYAGSYGVLDWIPKEKLELVLDESPDAFLKSTAKEDIGYYVFLPEIYSETAETRRRLEDVYMQFATPKKLHWDSELNYWNNKRSDCHPVSDLRRLFIRGDAGSRRNGSEGEGFGKSEFIIVAAGPSLDDNLEFLRQNQGKKTMIAVGTVFRKLLENGIVPDIVTVLDPQARTYKQIEGLEDQNVPMLLGVTAYWGFAANYQGDKYLVPLPGVHEEKENEEVWAIGGTVTHLATEAAIRFGAESIYLVGVDLAYPNGVSHAEGTMDRTVKGTEDMLPVEGVGGSTVYADSMFIAYRQWLEDRIALTPRITYYNMSRIGARIAGTKEKSFMTKKWRDE